MIEVSKKFTPLPNRPKLKTLQVAMSKLKLFFALSRTPHGFLDMMTPAFAALLWLGEFPSFEIVAIGLITAFAGYTAVYALNDLVDCRVDRQKLIDTESVKAGGYLDDVMVRHPMALGLLDFKEGMIWALSWGVVALIGAYLLNPVCLLIFLLGCMLEITYCLLLKVSYLRTFVSGAVKTLGAVAAVFAVDPAPSAVYLLLIFSTLFFWEIGGQNAPHDWNDIDEDRRIAAQTIPVRFGAQTSIRVILSTLVATVVLSLILLQFSGIRFSLPYVWAAFVIGVLLLVLPAAHLYRTRGKNAVMSLFNRASYYPAALLVVVLIRISVGE